VLLVDEMVKNENIGGVCGEIRVNDAKYCNILENA